MSSANSNTHTILDGYWLPKGLQSQFLTSATEFISLSFARGRPSLPDAEGAVTVRWPVLSISEWRAMLSSLDQNRRSLPAGLELWDRLKAALRFASRDLADPQSNLYRIAVASIPSYTGYSEAMIGFMLNALDFFELDDMPAAAAARPSWQTAAAWCSIPGISGRLQFFPRSPLISLLSRLPGFSNRSLHGPVEKTELIVGYGSGNVPGASLLIALLSFAAGINTNPPPALVVKNSRREPIFSPLILQALEIADPELVSALAVMIWDYQDSGIQDLLLSSADLTIAAASDETIAQIKSQIERIAPARTHPARFHAHGHKVSFSVIGREVFMARQAPDPKSVPLLDQAALLAALDSVFWDQHGCLSARIHFVEIDPMYPHSAEQYAIRLEHALRLLAHFLPRGSWPLQQLHDRFDRYKQLESTGSLQVLSGYDDEFVLVIDRRPLERYSFYSLVNDCQGRVVVVRPVDDLMEIPEKYLGGIPPQNLQSLSLALGSPGQGLDDRMLSFAEACGRRGVTAIRTVGRAAFPQLAYSWDGLIPPDLSCLRPEGYFTSMEFEVPHDQISANYQLLTSQLNQLDLAASFESKFNENPAPPASSKAR